MVAFLGALCRRTNKMIKNYIQESIDLKRTLLKDEDFIKKIENVINLLADCFKSGNKILIAGNGGSAADSQHFAAEIVCKFKKERRGYPAIALTANTSIITAWSNDYDLNSVFSRQIEALGKSGDVFIGISTSGNSENIVSVVSKAKEMGIKTICLLGNDGGKLKNAADLSIIVPSSNTPRIQEIHILLLHLMAEELEENF